MLLAETIEMFDPLFVRNGARIHGLPRSCPRKTFDHAAARVRAALRAAAERDAALRRLAAECACRASARCEAADRPSRLSADFTALLRLAEGLRAGRPCPRS